MLPVKKPAASDAIRHFRAWIYLIYLHHGVDLEYITWLTKNPNPTDTKTLIPFLKDMEQNLGFKYTEIVADAGYESEENYLFIEANGQTAFIKRQYC